MCELATEGEQRSGNVFALLVVGCGILGMLIGSFLNVVIYRVPRHESIVSPPSACPNCGEKLLLRDNIPVISWLLLRGKCRFCQAPIARRYPLVELLTGGLFVFLAARMGFNWALPAFLALYAGLIALSWIDVENLVLPRKLVYVHLACVGVLLTIAAAASHEWRLLQVGILCALGWSLLFFILNLLNPAWLGFGDVRFSLVLGLGLGWLGFKFVILGFFAANLIGLVTALALIAVGKIDRSRRIPYGVFLSLGAIFSIEFGSPLLVAMHLR